MYEAKINLNYNKLNFEEIIRFKKDKNTFIYNFKFHYYNTKNTLTMAQKSISYSKAEQFQIFKNALIKFNIDNKEKINKDLIIDSIGFQNEIYDFDYYLEILKSCISQKEVLLLLRNFDLKRIKYTQNMKINEYSSILEQIAKEHDIILCHCNKKENENQFLEKFYSLLLFFYIKLNEEKKNKRIIEKTRIKKYFFKNNRYFLSL